MSNYADIPALYLSDSSHARYHSCHRKLELAKFYGHARGDFEETIDTGAGKALHSGWQNWMAFKDKERAIWEMMREYPCNLYPSQMAPKSLEACYSALEEMMQCDYFESRYEMAMINTPFHNTPQPAIEVPFRITFKDVSILQDRYVPVYWDGFIDAILWDTLEQKYIVVDVKTTRKDRLDYTATFSRDPQCLPYAYVLEQAVGQTRDMLDVIIFVVYIDALNPRALPYAFIKTQSDIEQWAFGVAMDLQNMKMMADIGFFPKNGKSCDTFRVCPYNEVCDYTETDAIREYLDLRYGATDYIKKDKEFQPWFNLSLTVEGLS